MSCGHRICYRDNGPDPYILDMEQLAVNYSDFRTAVWTGCHMQMTLMCIPPCGEVGLEMHHDTDQLIRIEQGRAAVIIGKCVDRQEFQKIICKGDAVFVPAGTWHNIINIGRSPLKLSSVYAPPHHPWGTVHHTKADAQAGE